jgi:hypothetical protein
MTSAIVTSTYRYKPPPKRKGRKLAKITGPAIVTVKGSRRRLEAAAAEVNTHAARPPAGYVQPSTPSRKAPAPANDDRKSAIVTAARKSRSWRSDVPDMTPEEHQRRGDAADAMFRAMKRKIAAAP